MMGEYVGKSFNHDFVCTEHLQGHWFISLQSQQKSSLTVSVCRLCTLVEYNCIRETSGEFLIILQQLRIAVTWASGI